MLLLYLKMQIKPFVFIPDRMQYWYLTLTTSSSAAAAIISENHLSLLTLIVKFVQSWNSSLDLSTAYR